MLISAPLVLAILVPFLAVVGTVLAVLVCYIIVLHGVREIAFRRRQRLTEIYRVIVQQALDGDEQSIRQLAAAPRRHRGVLAALILDPLRVAGGAMAERASAAADAVGLVAQWKADLEDRRWWVRAESAHALGLIKCQAVVANLVTALDDPFDEVRAAAVEALGLIADPRSIPDLIARLSDQSRHQRVRLVHALHQFGSSAVDPLLEHARVHTGDRASVAELLGTIGATSAVDELLDWAHDQRVGVRAAVWRAIGTIGIDDRSLYHALRALGDVAEEVRASAAWAIGRSGRQDAAPYLAKRLNDEWLVAAHTARALRDLGPAGRRELEAAARGRSELARQMLWESGAPSRV